MIIEMFIYGFVSAFGWWSANHYVIEPHFPPSVEKKVDKKDDSEHTTIHKAGQ